MFLSFTASLDQPKPQDQLRSSERIGLYVGVIVAVLAVGSGLFLVSRHCSKLNGRGHLVVHETEKINAEV